MVEFDDLSFLHRKDRPLKDDEGTRDYLIDLIDRLLDLEASSHPSAGPCPKKNYLSQDAIQLAGRVLECSIGWAIDHQVGLVLNSAPSGAPPLFDDRAASAPADANNHLHEGTASEYSHMDEDLHIDKRMLWSLLMLLPHTLITGKLWMRTLAELHALDMGVSSKFFSPTKLGRGKKKKAAPRRFLQLKAVEHMEFFCRCEKGHFRKKARTKVAHAYGIDDQTLETWIVDLPKEHINREFFDEMSRRARNRGVGALKSEDENLIAREVEALQVHGAAFKTLNGTLDP